MKFELTISVLLLLVWCFDAAMVYSRQLMMLQQNSYYPSRYWRWFNTAQESTNYGNLGLVIAFLCLLVYKIPFGLGAIIAIGIMLVQGTQLAQRKYKKPLVYTNRVKRLMCTMFVLSAVIVAVPAIVLSSLELACLVAMGVIALSPLVMMSAYYIMSPVERGINRRYYNDARRRLESMPELKIVGVTGSYGKTSTKHYLHRILSEQYDTLMTPGSFNTTMGVIRTIREHLKPYNEVFIVEMGAKNIGDIKEICDLVHPQMGIVTAVGEQHLESFKTIENVQRTKFELIDSLPADGLCVVNNDFPYGANRAVDNVTCSRYAVSNPDGADYTARDIRYTPRGTSFTVVGPDGWELQLNTHLVGECNVSNLIGAVIIARALGVPDEKIQYAVERIEQVEHRLNMKRTAGGLTIIDDAYNSNPNGSRMALEVLGAMTGGRRIVITPGMIELGDKQDEYNEQLGRHIAANADVAIIVGHYNRDAILRGLEAAGMPSEKVYAVDTFTQAQQLLTANARPGDAVLYENDLPDTFK